MKTFFIIWGVILVLNQTFIFGGCLAPYCIAAAIPHTSVIAFLLTILLVKSDIEADDEKQKSELILNTEIGWIFKDKLIITQHEITWKDKTYKFENISRLIWWTINSDLGQLQFGDTYVISFGDDKSIFTIKTKRKILYDEIFKRLQANCEPKIIEEMINFFRNGHGKVFHNATIWDDGVTFIKKGGWFSADIKQKFSWQELDMKTVNGEIQISSIKDNSFTVNIDDNFYNIKFLEKLLKKVLVDRSTSQLSEFSLSTSSAMLKKIREKLLTKLKVEKESPKIVETNKFDDNKEKSIQESFNPTYFTDLKKTNNIEKDIDDFYFSNLKKDLERNKYEDHVRSIQNPNFEKIRKYCENLIKENKADEMQEYLGKNGRMYKALIYDALEQFIEKLNDETITLIDWGSGQGIGSMLVLDYIKQKQLEIVVDEVVLIDDNQKAISRAMAQISALQENSINFTTLENIKNSSVLHLFVNDTIPKRFYDEDFNKFTQSYFMCLSNENKQIIESVNNQINKKYDIQNVSSREGMIGKFSRFEKVFKINQYSVIDIDDDEIPF